MTNTITNPAQFAAVQKAVDTRIAVLLNNIRNQVDAAADRAEGARDLLAAAKERHPHNTQLHDLTEVDVAIAVAIEHALRDAYADVVSGAKRRDQIPAATKDRLS